MVQDDKDNSISTINRTPPKIRPRSVSNFAQVRRGGSGVRLFYPPPMRNTEKSNYDGSISIADLVNVLKCQQEQLGEPKGVDYSKVEDLVEAHSTTQLNDVFEKGRSM